MIKKAENTIGSAFGLFFYHLPLTLMRNFRIVSTFCSLHRVVVCNQSSASAYSTRKALRTIINVYYTVQFLMQPLNFHFFTSFFVQNDPLICASLLYTCECVKFRRAYKWIVCSSGMKRSRCECFANVLCTQLRSQIDRQNIHLFLFVIKVSKFVRMYICVCVFV